MSRAFVGRTRALATTWGQLGRMTGHDREPMDRGQRLWMGLAWELRICAFNKEGGYGQGCVLARFP